MKKYSIRAAPERVHALYRSDLKKNDKMPPTRKIIHIDMDAFYASVEQRDHPELRGKPVIVGGAPEKRGVVAACSYEAREFGIRSAMSSAKAYQLCPQAVFKRPRFEIYQEVSAQIRNIFLEYTDLVEPLSLDEAFLDVTENKFDISSATLIAGDILEKIYHRTGHLTASAGVSFNKFLAKTASDFRKPHGLTVVTPEQADSFIDKLPIRKFFGVGRVTEKKMLQLGIRNGADLKKFDKAKLIRLFGKSGHYFYDIAHGRDNRPVNADRIRKSLSKETTLKEDILDCEQILTVLAQIAEKLETSIKKKQLRPMTVTLKIKYFDFQSITRSITSPKPIITAPTIIHNIKNLLTDTEAGQKKIRLLGIALSNFSENIVSDPKPKQLLLPFKGRL